MLMVLHGNDGVHTHNRGSKDILGATTHYTPVMTIKYGTTTIHKMNASTSLDQFVCLSTNQDTVAPSLASSLLSKPSLVLTRVNTMFTRLERTLPTITSIVLAPRRWLV